MWIKIAGIAFAAVVGLIFWAVILFGVAVALIDFFGMGH